jgi:hypothetical protein
LTDIESTLAAAMADEGAGHLVQTGRVLKALSYSGFGQTAEAGSDPMAAWVPAAKSPASPGHPAPAATSPAPPGQPAAEKTSQRQDAQARAEAAQRLARAEVALEAARRTLADATAAEADANRGAEELIGQIAELRDQLDAAQRQARATRQARISAERDLASAQRRLDRAKAPGH